MIQLTKLNNETFTLNAFMIEKLQSHPDTTITLMNGKTIVVRETEKHVSDLITAYYQKIGLQGWLQEAGEVDE
ncbi:flagellar FlbD family protein [Virgibacillus oceani]|uniref:Flagellar protein FlbD n=1 Tax=Virgibacillus oceani TaxID=1479511 RepID=A0A917H6C3_9BACI|nr:flagellar FlbD family protein [Virgibacillus oceani]GGG68978.1 hypothetical protein GCM10011398_11160 [Virgibacillus oceani]